MVSDKRSGESNYWIPIEYSSSKIDTPNIELIDNRIDSFDIFFGCFFGCSFALYFNNACDDSILLI